MLRWLAALGFDYAAIVGAVAAFELWPSFLMGAAAILAIGTRQHGIAVLGHDGAHGSICANAQINDALAKICFLPFGISLARYRRFHFAHHRYVGTAKDPEHTLKAVAATAWDLPANPRRILLLSAKDFLVWPALRELLAFMALVTSPAAVFASTTIWALVAGTLGLQAVALCFAALSTSFWASNRLRIWTEHQGTNGTHRIWPTWWQRFLFLPHNIWVHQEHHQNARVPFYALPKLRTGASLSVWNLFRSYGSAPIRT